MKYKSPQIDLSAKQIGLEDEIMAENELLKLKFELEYGVDGIAPAISEELQNEWLKHIYSFEEQSKDAGRIRLYDFLERPEFKKTDDLSEDQIDVELTRIKSILESKGFALDGGTEYDDSVIYRFITEELFEHEIENISVKGMVTHFIYEEFHPNHIQDLRKYTEELIDVLFQKKWDRFDAHCFAGQVMFNGCIYDNEGIASIIQTFQEAHTSFSVEQFNVEDITFDTEKQTAEVQGAIRYGARGNGNRTHGGTCKISFTFQWGFWYISGFRFPGFGD